MNNKIKKDKLKYLQGVNVDDSSVTYSEEINTGGGISPVARIIIVGIGGAGKCSVNRMIEGGLEGVEFITIDSDSESLNYSLSPTKIKYELSSKESRKEVKNALSGADMVFFTCGLGGETSLNIAPIVAEISKELGALTVGIVTKPFSFEGQNRMGKSIDGFNNLKEKVDTLITIPNDRILSIIDKKTPLLDAFSIVDEILNQGVQGITDLITKPSLIGVDFADVTSVMENAGSAIIGIGYGSGEKRAIKAAKSAINSPLLGLSIEGAKGLLFNVVGGEDLSMFEVDEAAKIICELVDDDANIIFGTNTNKEYNGEIKITVVAVGIDKEYEKGQYVKLFAKTIQLLMKLYEKGIITKDELGIYGMKLSNESYTFISETILEILALAYINKFYNEIIDYSDFVEENKLYVRDLMNEKYFSIISASYFENKLYEKSNYYADKFKNYIDYNINNRLNDSINDEEEGEFEEDQDEEYEEEEYDDEEDIDLYIPKGADINTYIDINDTYGKDKDYVYRHGYKLLGADPKSFVIINKIYTKDKDNVYYYGKKIDGVDAKSFEMIDEYYGKDKNNVYYGGNIIENSDPDSFVILKGFCKDKNNIYRFGVVLEGADIDSIQVLSYEHCKDKNNIYWFSGNAHIKLSNSIDVDTFEFLKYHYTKDKNNIYYNSLIIEGIDINTYEILNWDYIKDKSNIYYEGKIFEIADYNTFEIIDNSYAKDKNNVYHYGEKIDGIDINSFSILEDNNYIKDKDNIYFFLDDYDEELEVDNSRFIKIENVDIDSFELLDNYYSKDKNYIYYHGMVLKGINPNSYDFLDEFYFYIQSEDIIMHFGKEIEGVDVESFEILDDWYSKDKNNVYHRCKIIEGADLKSFEVFGDRNARDKYRMYNDHELIVKENSKLEMNYSNNLSKIESIVKTNDDININETISNYDIEKDRVIPFAEAIQLMGIFYISYFINIPITHLAIFIIIIILSGKTSKYYLIHDYIKKFNYFLILFFFVLLELSIILEIYLLNEFGQGEFNYVYNFIYGTILIILSFILTNKINKKYNGISITTYIKIRELLKNESLSYAEKYISNKNYIKGIEIYDKILLRYPKDLSALFGKANALYYLNKYDEAYNIYKSFNIEDFDNDSKFLAYSILGGIHAGLGNIEKSFYYKNLSHKYIYAKTK